MRWNGVRKTIQLEDRQIASEGGWCRVNISEQIGKAEGRQAISVQGRAEGTDGWRKAECELRRKSGPPTVWVSYRSKTGTESTLLVMLGSNTKSTAGSSSGDCASSARLMCSMMPSCGWGGGGPGVDERS